VTYLLDTCVISELQRQRPAKEVVDWMQSIDPSDTFISVISVGEIEKGAHALAKRDARRASEISGWLTSLRKEYGDRVVSVDSEAALIWGRLAAARSRAVPDALIAATALQYNLAVVTRNVADFADTGVHITNPWAG